MSNELKTVKQAAFWAAGVVLGLIAISFILGKVGVTPPALAPEDVAGAA